MIPEEEQKQPSVDVAVKNVKPQPLLCRRAAAALIDAAVVGFVGALIPVVLVFIMVRLEMKTMNVFNDGAIFLYLGSAGLLSLNWICPLILFVIGGSWAVWIAKEGFFPHILFPIALLSIAPLYEVYFLSSSAQATPGKRLVGLKVQSQRHSKITLAQALWRHIARAVSAVSIVGYCIAFANTDHRCLHDMVCRTRVIDAKPNDPTPNDPTRNVITLRQNMIVFVVLSVFIGILVGLLFLTVTGFWRHLHLLEH